jgi:hypothetical protein
MDTMPPLVQHLLGGHLPKVQFTFAGGLIVKGQRPMLGEPSR